MYLGMKLHNAIDMYTTPNVLCQPKYKSLNIIEPNAIAMPDNVAPVIIGAITATASIGVKLGGCGIILLKAIVDTNTIK